MVGVPLAILQLVLICKYWKGKVMEEPVKQDVEKGNIEKEGLEVEIGDIDKKDLEKSVTKS